MRRVDEEDLEYPDDLTALLDGKPFTGQAVEYDDGNPVELMTYVGGVENGPRLTWSPNNGQLVVQGNMRYPHPVGPWHYWDEDGKLARERIFDTAGNLRIMRTWDEAGNLTSEERYEPEVGLRNQATGEENVLRWR
ncbi:hypothetical protein HFP72_20010 [Nocardiopsis sp. ARC36]|jgi:antitoxin component YwqK of YwqJK toxin-antitoxin module